MGVFTLPGIDLLDGSSYWTKLRRELIQWFDERAPSFTEGYVAAVRLLHTADFPARVHLICHVVRDIYRYLPATLGLNATSRPSEVFPRMVKDLADTWSKYPPTGRSASSKPAGADLAISSQVYTRISALVDKSVEMANQPQIADQLAIALFRSLERREDEFIHPWIIKSFKDEYSFFVSRAHLAISMEKVPNDDGLPSKFEAFERAFHSLVGPYFSGKEELDDILHDTNKTAD